MATLTPFGIALRKLRIERGLRLFDLADKLGQSTAFLSAVETGRKPIPDGLVLKITRALDLSIPELKELRSASDRTKKEVKVDDKSEADRELIAAFARRLDSVPDELLDKIKGIILKSVSNEFPFRRKRRGFQVPPLSSSDLKRFAGKVRSAFVRGDEFKCPIIGILEFGILQIDAEFVFDVRDVDEMGENEGLVPVGGNSLILRRDVYDGACQDSPRDRFTACHEFAHYLMHRKLVLARTTRETDKVFCDSEWQADAFAGYLMMNEAHLPNFASSSDMAEKCGVSQQAALVMWEKYRKEGLVR